MPATVSWYGKKECYEQLIMCKKPMVKYQILVKCDRVAMVIDEWMNRGTSDITLRRAKTKGCRVIETTDVLYAQRLVKWLQVAVQINIVKQK